MVRNKILIADNEEVIRNLYTLIINNSFPSYAHETFDDGVPLKRRLEQDVSDVALVITDNNMTHLDGLPIIQQYAKTPKFYDKENQKIIIPFLLVSSLDEEVRQSAESAGIFGYIGKPAKLTEMIKAIERALKRE